MGSESKNKSNNNKLIITTHSPYIINYLTLLIKAEQVRNTIKNCEDQQQIQLNKQLEELISVDAAISSDQVSIFQLDKEGSISLLDNYEGLPSDENYLNNSLESSNNLFTELLEIEDLCQ